MHAYIINQTMSGTYFIEGRAKVVKALDDEGRSLVDFEDGYGPVERFVDPDAQTDNVAAYVASLNDSPK